MEEAALSKLSAEQLAALNDELKAAYCALDETDQVFFASTFKPKDLPKALARKAEIMKRDQTRRERMERLEALFAQQAAEPSRDTTGDVLTAAAGVLGIGAAAAAVATDNTAFYQGVQPADLVEPLRIEFQSANTTSSATGDAQALIFTVFLLDEGQRVAAMTVNLTALNNGTEVKVNELSSQGILQAIKAGGGKLLDLAGKGIDLLRRGQSGDLGGLISTADQALDSGARLAETVNNLKLKERAWKVIRQAAEAIEASYLDQLEKEREARAALERAWDNFYQCPTCGVSFGAEDTTCRVCGTGRPEKPVKPDPRQ